MDRYGVKAIGTKEELEAISKALERDLDDNGVCIIEEDYEFSLVEDEIEEIAINMAKAAKSAKFLIRGFTEDEKYYIEHEIVYDGKKLILRSTGWLELNPEIDRDDFFVDWLGEGTFKDREWYFENEVQILGQIEATISIKIAGATKKEFRTVLRADWPIDIELTDFHLYHRILDISFTRMGLKKDIVDEFVEAISVCMPEKEYDCVVMFSEVGDGSKSDSYKYVCKEGNLVCLKIIGEKNGEYITEVADMKRMRDEEKQILLASMEGVEYGEIFEDKDDSNESEPPKRKERYKEDYFNEGGDEVWEALLETYKKPLPSFCFIPFTGELIATPDVLWFEYSNPVIDELVNKYNYENKHFKYNSIDYYDDGAIIFDRVIARTFGKKPDSPNVMEPFPFYGSDDIEDFTKSLLSLLIITGEPNEEFKKEAIERVQEIANTFLNIEASFIKNIMGDYTDFNEKIVVDYDGVSYDVEKYIWEGCI